MSYINETVGGSQQILDGRTTPKYYVSYPNGRLGPFASRAIAEGIILGQPVDAQPSCRIDEVVDGGNQILLG